MKNPTRFNASLLFGLFSFAICLSGAKAQNNSIEPEEKYELSCYVSEAQKYPQPDVESFKQEKLVTIGEVDGSKLADMTDKVDRQELKVDQKFFLKKSGLEVKLNAQIGVTRRIIRFNNQNRVTRDAGIYFTAEIPSLGLKLIDTSALLQPFEGNQFGLISSTGVDLQIQSANTTLKAYCSVNRPQK